MIPSHWAPISAGKPSSVFPNSSRRTAIASRARWERMVPAACLKPTFGSPSSWTCTNHLPRETLPYLWARSHRKNSFHPYIFCLILSLSHHPWLKASVEGLSTDRGFKLRTAPSAPAHLFSTTTTLSISFILEQESKDILQPGVSNPPF